MTDTERVREMLQQLNAYLVGSEVEPSITLDTAWLRSLHKNACRALEDRAAPPEPTRRPTMDEMHDSIAARLAAGGSWVEPLPLIRLNPDAGAMGNLQLVLLGVAAWLERKGRTGQEYAGCLREAADVLAAALEDRARLRAQIEALPASRFGEFDGPWIERAAVLALLTEGEPPKGET